VKLAALAIAPCTTQQQRGLFAVFIAMIKEPKEIPSQACILVGNNAI
jgi:hypothetical protein